VNNLLRNLSLGANLLLLALLCLLVGWVWKERQLYIRVLDQTDKQQKIIGTYEEFINTTLNADTYVGRPFPKLNMIDVQNRPVSTDFAQKKSGLVLLFKPKACQPCLTTQLKVLQHIYDELENPEELPIYAFSDEPPEEVRRFTRAFDLEYPLISDAEGKIVDSDLAQTTPIVFLVDRENKITKCHIPSTGKSEHSILFYNQLRRIHLAGNLHIAMDQSSTSFGLGGVPFVQVVRNEYDNSQVRHLLY
jgi:peroxiredoxin